MEPAGFLSFPSEILLHISEFLTGEDLLKLSQTCHYLNYALNDDYIWKKYAPESISQLKSQKQLAKPIFSLDEDPLKCCEHREHFMMSRHILNNWRRFNCVCATRTRQSKRLRAVFNSFSVPNKTREIVYNDHYIFLGRYINSGKIEVWDIKSEPFLLSFIPSQRVGHYFYYVLGSNLVVAQCRGIDVYNLNISNGNFPFLYSFAIEEVNSNWEKSAIHEGDCDGRCLSWSHYNAGQYLGSIKNNSDEPILHVWDVLNAWKLGAFVIPVSGYRPEMTIFSHEGDEWIIRHSPGVEDRDYCSYLFNVKKLTFSKSVFKNELHSEGLIFYKSHVIVFKEADRSNSQGLFDSVCVLYDFETSREMKRRRFNNAGKDFNVESTSIINGSFVILCFDCFLIVDALTLETIYHVPCDLDVKCIIHQFSVFGTVFIVARGGDNMLHMWNMEEKKKPPASLGVAYTSHFYLSRNFASLVLFYSRKLKVLRFW